MIGASSSFSRPSVDRCKLHELSNVDSDFLANAENRAQEQHKKRLARIVADQWMHVARKRLTMAWCFQMVHCWRKICSENRWTRQQSYLASKHHTGKKFFKALNAFREGNRTKQSNQSTAVTFRKEILQKKTLKGLRTTQSNYREYHERQCLAKALRAIKGYHDMKKATKRMYNGAQLYYGTCLKKQALSGLSNHRERFKLKSSYQAAASYHWKKHMKFRILRCWDIIAKRISDLRKKGDQTHIYLLKALLKRCMKNWLLVTQKIVTSRQVKIALASHKYSKSQKEQILRAWAQRSRDKQSRRLKLEQAAMVHSNHTSAAVTNVWRNYVVVKGEKRAQSSVAFSFRRRQALRDAIAIWKAYQTKKIRAGVAALKALAHLKRNLTKKSMDAWRPWHKRHISKKQDREKALEIYKSRLQRWACERILAVGLMLQALRLQSKEGRHSISSASPYMKVAPYARKWWYISRRRSNLRKALLDRKEEGSSKTPQKEEVLLPTTREPFTHEVLVRIGIDKDGLKILHERPPSPLLEMTNVQDRPQARGRTLLPPTSPPQTQASATPTLSAIRQRPAPRRPTFLSI